MHRTDDEGIFEEFLRRLGDEDVRTSADGAVELRSWEDVELDVPLRLRVTPRSLGEPLRALEHAGASAFPEAQPVVGALQLFLVHLDEAIRTRRPGHTDLVPDTTGVRSAPPHDA